jgi:hypothetical protein
MKRQGAIILVVVLAAMTVWGMICQVSGQAKPEQKATSKEPAGFTIARVVVGTGVENNEPVGVAESFPVSTEKVYCFLQANDIAKDTEVSFVWFHGQDEKLKTILPLKMGKRWRTYANKNLRGLKGDWKIEIKDAGGNLLREVKFKVE